MAEGVVRYQQGAPTLLDNISHLRIKMWATRQDFFHRLGATPNETILGMRNPKPISVWNYIFGWPYAGVLVGSAFGGAIGVAGFHHFTMAYILFAIAGAGMIGHWRVADPVTQRREAMNAPSSLKHNIRRARAISTYRKCFWGGVTLILAFIALCLYLTLIAKLGYERDEVARNLDITYEMPAGGDVLDSKFSIKNNSGFDISKRHQITCMVDLVVNGAGYPMLTNMMMIDTGHGSWSIGSPKPFTPATRDFPIRAYGDEQTDSCLAAIKGQTISCADIFVDFSYYLEDQHQVQDRLQRIFFTRNGSGTLGWQGQPIQSKEDFCYTYLSTLGKSVRDENLKEGVDDFSRKYFWVIGQK